MTVDSLGNLVLRDVAVSDDGEYMCVASNAGGNSTMTTIVDVQVPPFIEDPGHNSYTVIKGLSVQLPCVAHGDPTPIVTWQKNRLRIQGKGQFSAHSRLSS